MIEYNSAYDYITTAKNLQDKIAKMDAVIEALEDTMLKSATKSHLTEYDLNDGQTRIKAAYRNTKDIADSIVALQRLREEYVNKLNGRRVRLIDSKSFFRR